MLTFKKSDKNQTKKQKGLNNKKKKSKKKGSPVIDDWKRLCALAVVLSSFLKLQEVSNFEKILTKFVKICEIHANKRRDHLKI